MPAWKKEKLPLHSVGKFLTKMTADKMPVVLIDVRDAASASAGHIPGAVSIPGEQLASYKERFPTIKSAPVVLYGTNEEQAKQYFSLVRGWGYKNTTILSDGFSGWKNAGLPVESGKTAAEIVYVPKPKPGVIAINTFKQAVDRKADDVVVLDVRTDEETAEGKLPAALAIPAEEVGERLDEIPKNKQIFVHCSTGVRAEMAYLNLKEKGYNAQYLDAQINVSPDGSFEITAKQ